MPRHVDPIRGVQLLYGGQYHWSLSNRLWLTIVAPDKPRALGRVAISMERAPGLDIWRRPCTMSQARMVADLLAIGAELREAGGLGFSR